MNHGTLEALQGQLLHEAGPAFAPAKVEAAIVHLPRVAPRLTDAEIRRDLISPRWESHVGWFNIMGYYGIL